MKKYTVTDKVRQQRKEAQAKREPGLPHLQAGRKRYLEQLRKLKADHPEYFVVDNGDDPGHSKLDNQ